MSKIESNNQIHLTQFKVGAKIKSTDSSEKKSVFNMIDKNGDGVIGKDEYQGTIKATIKGKDGKPIEKELIKLKSLENGRSLCVDNNGKQWVVAADGTILSDKYVEAGFSTSKMAETQRKEKEQEILQKQAAKTIVNDLTKATNGFNDNAAIKTALSKIDNPVEMKEVERLLAAKGYKGDKYYSPIEKFMQKEMGESKSYDKSFDELETQVQKWIANGTLKGDDAIKAQARLSARLIIDGCDGFGTDVDEAKEGVRLIKSPVTTGDQITDSINAKKVYDEVNNIIKEHSSFGAGFKDLKDYLKGDVTDSELKYIDGILAQNEALDGTAKADAIRALVQDSVEGGGTDIDYLKQAIRGIKSPDDRKNVEAEMKAYCEAKGIQPKIEGQSYLQAVLYDECDTFLGVSTDHKEIRKFNEQLIAQGAYTPEEAAKLRAEGVAIQMLEGDYSNITAAVSEIKDKATLSNVNRIFANENHGSLKGFLNSNVKDQTNQDMLWADLGSRNLITKEKATEVATRLVQNSDFNVRAKGLSAIRSGEIASAVDNNLKANGSSLEKVMAKFNEEKAEYQAKAAVWDTMAITFGNVAEYISDQYRTNTDMSNNLYVESDKTIELSAERKKFYAKTVGTFEKDLEQMKADYEASLESDGVVAGAVNAFCSRYNLGTTRDEIEARIEHDTETLRLLNLAKDGKLAKIVDGKTVAVSFEDVFSERQSAIVTGNGVSISELTNVTAGKKVTLDADKMEKVTNKAQTIAAMHYANEHITVAWSELENSLKTNDNRELSTSICNTLDKLSKMSGNELSLEAYGLELKNGVLVDKQGKPASVSDLKNIANQLKSGLSEVTRSLYGVSIPSDASSEDVSGLLEDGYANKLEAFKEEYKDAFGKEMPSDMIESYKSTIATGEMVVKIGASIGAVIAAPFTGGGSLAVFTLGAGASMGISALENSTDADGYTNAEWTNDAENAFWDGVTSAIGYKVGVGADKFIAKEFAQGSKLANTTAKLMDKNKALLLKANPNMNPEVLAKAATRLAKLEAIAGEGVSDAATSLLQSSVMNNGEIDWNSFWHGMVMSVGGNVSGHVFSSVKTRVMDGQNVANQVADQVDNISISRRENQSSMRATSRSDVSSQPSVSSNKNIITSQEWTSAGVNAYGTEIKLKQNAAGNVIVDLGSGRAKLVRFAKGQTRIDLGQDANGANMILTKSPNGEIRLSKLDSNSRASRLDSRVNPEPRKSSLDTDPKPKQKTQVETTTVSNKQKSSQRYIDKPIENENLAALAKRRYPNPSDELKERLLDIDASISTIKDPYILEQINKMQDLDEIERLADIMNELEGNYSAYERVLKFQDGDYIVRSNASEFSSTVKELDADGYKAFMDGQEVTQLSGNKNVKGLSSDLNEETRLYTMKEYLKDNNRRSEVSDYLYNKYYLDKLDVAPTTKARMQEIASTYNTRVFIGQDTQGAELILDKLEDEFKNFEKASNYQAKLPPVVDFNRINQAYFKRVAGSAFSESRTGSVAFSRMDIRELEESLRHELIHSNDRFLKKGIEISTEDFPDVFPQNTKIDPKTGEYIIDLNECKYADEFRKAGLEDWIIEYAHTDPKEFVAVAAEGDMSKYSLELQGVLKKMGMPDWAFNLPAPVKTSGVDVSVAPNTIGKIGDERIAASPLRRFKEMFGGSSEINLSKNYDISANGARKDYPDDVIVKSGQHQRALGSTAPSTVKNLDSSVNPRNIAQHVDNGGVCSINGKLYVNNNGQAVELKMSQQTFERLFPEKGFAAIKQQGVNNCWLVSSLNSMGDVAEGRIKLYTMLEELPNGAIKVNLQGEKPLIFPNGKPLTGREIQLGEGAAPGVEMIEQAILTKTLKGGKGIDVVSSSDVSALIDKANAFESSQFTAFTMLHGKGKVGQVQIRAKESVDEYGARLKEWFDNNYKSGDFVGANWNYHARHVVGYDPNTKMITIHDPHYDGVDVQMSIDEFVKNSPSMIISKNKATAPSAGLADVSSAKVKPEVQQTQVRAESSAQPKRRVEIGAESPKAQSVSAQVKGSSVEPKTTNIMGSWREVATTADGLPINAKVVGNDVVISKNGKETTIPVSNGEQIPVYETSTDSYLIVKREGYKVSITRSATPELDDVQTSSVKTSVQQAQPQVSSSVASKPQTKVLNSGIEYEVGTINGRPLKAKYVSLSADRVATVQVNGKSYNISAGSSLNVTTGVEIKCDKFGRVSVVNSQVQPQVRSSSNESLRRQRTSTGQSLEDVRRKNKSSVKPQQATSSEPQVQVKPEPQVDVNVASQSVATPVQPQTHMLASGEKEVGVINGKSIKARLIARSSNGVATVEVGGKQYDIKVNEKIQIASGIELECDNRGLVKINNTQAAPIGIEHTTINGASRKSSIVDNSIEGMEEDVVFDEDISLEQDDEGVSVGGSILPVAIKSKNLNRNIGPQSSVIKPMVTITPESYDPSNIMIPSGCKQVGAITDKFGVSRAIIIDKAGHKSIEYNGTWFPYI